MRVAISVLLSVMFLVCLPIAAQPDVGEYEDKMSKKESGACATVMCLAGGDGLSECMQYLNPFYEIEVFTNLMFDPRATLNARKAMLALCGSVEESIIDQYNNSFRRSQNRSGVYNEEGIEMTYWEVYQYEKQYGVKIIDEFGRPIVETD